MTTIDWPSHFFAIRTIAGYVLAFLIGIGAGVALNLGAI